MLDTVLVILLLVGFHNRKLIGKDKRLSTYVPEDLDTLARFVGLFESLVTTPNILTEVSNLTAHLFNTDYPSELARQIAYMDEHYIPTKQLCLSGLFHRIGVSDTAIAHVSQGEFLVLTDDLRLVGHLEKQKIDVINFNHIRTLNW